VLPAVFALEAAERGGRAGPPGDGIEGGGARLDIAPVEFEIDGLRPYREGSPASRIHWPAVARSGEMIERRLVAGSSSAPLVVLDALCPASTEALDRAVRAAASLCVHLARTGGCTILLPGTARPLEVDSGLTRWPRVHARLALVAAGETVHAAPGSSSAVLWVSGAAGREAARAARRWCRGVGPVYVISPLPAPGLPGVFAVAGCTAQLLGGARAALRRPAVEI
jgi:uncharacterized protein (DUF58 family)